MNRFIVLLTLVLPLLFSCSENRQPIELLVVETSDVHGAVFPFDLLQGDSLDHSMAHVYSYVSEQREVYGDRLILLDNGDLIQGDPSAYYYNFIDTTAPHLYADLLNYMGYDAASVGNHDIEAGHPVYDRIREEFNFPWLAANTVRNDNGEPYFEPYTIIERQGVRIAILGLITPAIPKWLPEELWEGMHFDPMVESARKWIPEIRDKEDPDVIIGLFHAGADTSDRARQDQYMENASSIVAQEVEGFDLILVGHDHRGWNMKVPSPSGDSVLILGTTSKARNVAVAKMILNPVGNDGWDLDINGEIVEMQDYLPHRGLMEEFSDEARSVIAFVRDTIGELETELAASSTVFGPSAYTGLIHQVQLELSGAEISFTAPLTTSMDLMAGPIRMGDLFRLYRYENMLNVMELSGSEIDAYLEYSFNGWFNVMTEPTDYILKYRFEETGELATRYGRPVTQSIYYNFSRAAGIEYTLDLRKPEGERVNISRLSDGRVFHPDSTYRVAINSYRGSGGGGHLTEGAGIPNNELASRIIWTSEKDLRFHLMEWIKENSPFSPEIVGSWSIIPEDWYKQALKREKAMWD